jgi:hypothetical protein
MSGIMTVPARVAAGGVVGSRGPKNVVHGVGGVAVAEWEASACGIGIVTRQAKRFEFCRLRGTGSGIIEELDRWAAVCIL